MSLKGKLNRFKKDIKANIKKKNSTKMENQTIHGHNDVPFMEEWMKFDTTPFFFDGHYSFIREKVYPLNFKHGLYPFSELFSIVDCWKEYKGDHPLSSAEVNPSNMIFFDTETTGLGGGVGNTIFLIGYARVYRDRVTVKQHFLPSPQSEIPMYQGFLTDIDDISDMKLTSYNGKAFDWPQVKTRHTLIRDAVPKLPLFGHFDLLHASRRIWKKTLPSVRLSVVEKEVLNIQRNQDVPGYLAPMLYFDFLNDPNPKAIQGVFTHNELDVLTLITLYIHLSKLILNKDLNKITSQEQFEIAKWFESLGEYDLALTYYQLLQQKESSFFFEVSKAMANIYKKQKKYKQAVAVWENLFQQNHLAYHETIAIELAKAYEHHIKDFEKALYYAKVAYESWKQKKRMIKVADHQERELFLKRIERVQRKMKNMKNCHRM